jgi:hypothetical protein
MSQSKHTNTQITPGKYPESIKANLQYPIYSLNTNINININIQPQIRKGGQSNPTTPWASTRRHTPTYHYQILRPLDVNPQAQTPWITE